MKYRIALVAAASVLALAATTLPAQAAATRYPNCTKLQTSHGSQFRGGVATPGAKDKRTGGGHAKYKPYVSKTWYDANKGLDRDKDGIACEQ